MFNVRYNGLRLIPSLEKYYEPRKRAKDEDVYLITHVGKFTKKKFKRSK